MFWDTSFGAFGRLHRKCIGCHDFRPGLAHVILGDSVVYNCELEGVNHMSEKVGFLLLGKS